MRVGGVCTIISSYWIAKNDKLLLSLLCKSKDTYALEGIVLD
jgi:hypothetical protein